MIYLPVFDNYVNVDINMKFEEKDTIGGAIKELAGIGLSGPSINDFSRVLIRYVKYFRFLNNYRTGFDAVLNGLIQGVNVSKQFKEFMNRFQDFKDIKFFMQKDYKNKITKEHEIEILSHKGMLFLEMKGYTQLFLKDHNLFTDINNIKGFQAFDEMVHKVYQHYHDYLTDNGVDQWRLFSLNTKYIEEHFEAVFNSLYQDISIIQNPEEARQIARSQTKHIWREVLPPCDEDNNEEGIRLLIGVFGFKNHVYYSELTKMFERVFSYVFNYLQEIKPLLVSFPHLGNYYSPQIQIFEEFIYNHTKYMMEMIQKMFPCYITKSGAEDVYNMLINVNYIPKEYVDYFKKFKKWFEDIGDTVEEKINNYKLNKNNEKMNEELVKLIKQKDKILKNMEKYQKQKNYDDYRSERRKLKSLINDIEKIKVDDATNVINDIKTIISNTKQTKKELKMRKYILGLNEYPSIKELIKQTNIFFEEKYYSSIQQMKDSIKRELENFEESINKFDGDIEELKKIDLYKEIIEKANEALKRELPGGKSIEAAKMEQFQIPVVNAYLPSIDMYANLAPNPMMIASVMMMKANIVTEVNKLRPFINESEEIKKCVELADNKFKILDEYIVKCSSPPK